MTAPTEILPINQTCPWSGKPVAAEALTRYRGWPVGFCNPGCRDKFDRAVDHFETAIRAQNQARTLFQLAGAPAQPLSLAEAVLVVIDAQAEYRDGALPLAGIDDAVVAAATLLARARAEGSPVIHIVHRGRPGGLFDPAGPGGAILPDLAPLAGESVIGKALPNAFADTDLAARIAATGRTGIILAGFMTHMCISSTARAALDRALRVTLAADATATRALPDPLGGPDLPATTLQQAALAALADRFAAVTQVAALL